MGTDEKLVYVRKVSDRFNGGFELELIYSTEPDVVWGDDWDFHNPSICEDTFPGEQDITSRDTVIVKVPFSTAQENGAYSLEHCTFDILALAWINIDGMDEYPANGRCVLHFGMEKEKVRELLEPYIFKND